MTTPPFGDDAVFGLRRELLVVTVVVSLDSIVSVAMPPDLGIFFLLKLCTVLVTVGRSGSSDFEE